MKGIQKSSNRREGVTFRTETRRESIGDLSVACLTEYVSVFVWMRVVLKVTTSLFQKITGKNSDWQWPEMYAFRN